MVNKLLRNGAQLLENSDTPLLDARVLLAKAMGIENAAIIFNMPDENQQKTFEHYIELRKTGMPVAYIIGEKEFMGLTFKLNSDTLIPRPDTECLVEKIIEYTKKPDAKILDLCTGSGCIGISLVKMIENATCDLTDISDGALSAAEENARLNNVENRTNVFKLDVLKDEIVPVYDIIVSNPPYIESAVTKALAVSKFEPIRALDGGDDGLTFYRVIAKKAYDALSEGGMLALEIGYNQKDSVKALLKDFSSVHTFKDYGGNDRVIIAKKQRAAAPISHLDFAQT